jgi:hypothetical protein
MHLIQLLLPLRAPDGTSFPRDAYDALGAELTERFGGLTAYTRAPATGLWKPGAGPPAQDDIVIYEVMAESIDGAWWSTLRRRLEVQFQQDALVIRTHPVTLL